jgi:hypothetical protein
MWSWWFSPLRFSGCRNSFVVRQKNASNLTAIVLHSYALFGGLMHLDAQALNGRNVVRCGEREVGQNILYYILVSLSSPAGTLLSLL